MTVDINWGVIEFIWGVVMTLISGIGFVMAWAGRRSNVTNDTITEVFTRMNALQAAVTTLAEAQKHAPDMNDLINLGNSISTVSQSVAELKGAVHGEMGGVTRQLSLIQEVLMNQGNK